MSNYMPVNQMRISELYDLLDAWRDALPGVTCVTYFRESGPRDPFLMFHHFESNTYLNLEVTCGRIRATWTDTNTGNRVQIEKTLVSEALREVMRQSARFR